MNIMKALRLLLLGGLLVATTAAVAQTKQSLGSNKAKGQDRQNGNQRHHIQFRIHKITHSSHI